MGEEQEINNQNGQAQISKFQKVRYIFSPLKEEEDKTGNLLTSLSQQQKSTHVSCSETLEGIDKLKPGWQTLTFLWDDPTNEFLCFLFTFMMIC